jgi:gas vesicle protein
MVKCGDFWKGMLIGAAAGAVTALLTAPKKGSEMRDDLSQGTHEIGRKAGAAWGDVRDKTCSAVDSAKQQAIHAADRSRAFAESTRERLHQAVSAGKEAAAHKKEEMTAELQSAVH